MAKRAPKKDTAGVAKSGGRKKKPAPAAPSPLTVAEVAGSPPTPEVDALAKLVEQDGGAVLTKFREPYGGRFVLLVALPIDKVEPTPYQRDVSPAHVKRLARSIEKVGRFLDPVLTVRHDGRYWVPNGGHRLAALREAKATVVTSLLIPEEEVAHKILALNTEKAHNLRERALEVVRLSRALVGFGEKRPESAFELELEEGGLVTLGIAYEKRPRISGSSYASLLRKVDPLTDTPLPDALPRREKIAEKLLEADELIGGIVEKLKEKGFKSPYLKAFVVARISPLPRWGPEKDAPPPPADEALTKLIANARAFDTERVNVKDLAATSGPPPESEE